MSCCKGIFGFKSLNSVYDIDFIISIPALKASITPIAITLKGFFWNRMTALINEAANNAAIKNAGATTMGSSFVNITIVSIFIFTLYNLRL